MKSSHISRSLVSIEIIGLISCSFILDLRGGRRVVAETLY